MKTLKSFYYSIVSASWFHQLEDKKILKFEVFYLWMSVSCLLLGFAIIREVKLEIEFQTLFYWLITPFLIGAIMRVGSYFYKPEKEIEDQYPKTQLFRFLDPGYGLQKLLYPNYPERLRKIKNMWYAEYQVNPEWVKANAPFLQRNQWAICLVALFLGMAIAYLIY